MTDTKDYRNVDGPGTMCGRYDSDSRVIGDIECEYEKRDRWHRNACKYFDHNSGMCRK